MKARKLLASVAVIGATLGLVASPAAAGENIRARTTDSNPGGEAYWFHDGDRFRVCDIQSDGWAAYGEVRREDGFFTWEVDGGDDGCDTITWPVTDGWDVDIRVCLTKNDGATVHYCSGWKDGEA